ncbi:GspH/FimT family protein, partial [Xanthomonas citri]|uniref:GspH/FimT family protein n=2 Tax=Xanthomonas citri TaxID=346 RepID=UPI001F5BF146
HGDDLAVGKAGLLHGTSSGKGTRKFHFWRLLMRGGITVEHDFATGGIDIVSTAGRSIVRFLPNGRSSGTNITISLCSNARRLADVVVNNSGRARTVRYTSPTGCTAR